MNETVEFQSRVGDDGVLDLHLPLGQRVAGADVVITIRPVGNLAALRTVDPAERRRLLDESYGSCSGLGLERAPQDQFETREPVE
jgi:hypothetical protein